MESSLKYLFPGLLATPSPVQPGAGFGLSGTGLRPALRPGLVLKPGLPEILPANLGRGKSGRKETVGFLERRRRRGEKILSPQTTHEKSV